MQAKLIDRNYPGTHPGVDRFSNRLRFCQQMHT
jgi:hypothetical protein